MHVGGRGIRAHPRVGGENRRGFFGLCGLGGSSPRGRGKPRQLRYQGSAPGLIPAWAGKTEYPATGGQPRPAHPRVGGENSSAALAGAGASGSSPRGRGKRRKCRALTARQGLIPAWAGKTRCGCATGKTRWAHPRVGGGKLEVLNTRPTPAGLIPAWAGKT